MFSSCATSTGTSSSPFLQPEGSLAPLARRFIGAPCLWCPCQRSLCASVAQSSRKEAQEVCQNGEACFFAPPWSCVLGGGRPGQLLGIPLLAAHSCCSLVITEEESLFYFLASYPHPHAFFDTWCAMNDECHSTTLANSSSHGKTSPGLFH